MLLWNVAKFNLIKIFFLHQTILLKKLFKKMENYLKKKVSKLHLSSLLPIKAFQTKWIIINHFF